MDFITQKIVEFCSNPQLPIVIYTIMFILLIIVIIMIIKEFTKTFYVKDIIKIVTNKKDNNETEIEELSYKITKTNEEKLEIVQKNFPILVQEVKDVYNNAKPKQISAIDIFENNLQIPQNIEMGLRTLINSFTSLGLLGTFIGLISSINKINPEQTSTGIKALLGSIGPAIGTTIVGVVLSLIGSYLLTYLKARYKSIALRLEKEIMLDKPNDTNPDYFYDSFTTFTGKKYENALAKIVNNFLEQMKGTLTEDLENYKNALKDAITNLSENEEKFNVAADGLSSTVENINKYLQETDKLNKNFEQKLQNFTDALDNFDTNFKNTNEAAKEALSNVQSINEKNLEMNSKLYDSLQTELEETKQAFELIKEMNYNFKNEVMNTPIQIDSSIKVMCENIDSSMQNLYQSIEKISNEIQQTPAQITNAVNNLCNNIDECSNKLETKTNNTLKEMTNKVNEITDKIEKNRK